MPDDDLRFDLALSYGEEDSWIARDLHNLAKRYGFSVYCYDYRPDAAYGFLRSRLRDIYSVSSVNLVIWSRAYAAKPSDSIPAMERRQITYRHVECGDAASLMIVAADDTPLEADFQQVLAHRLQREGLLRTAEIVADRLRRLGSPRTPTGPLRHPDGTERDRGPLYPCVFKVNPSYKNDPYRRWEKLADVLITPGEPLRTRSVYLIPSALTTPLLRHTEFLRNDPKLLELKRAATERWVEEHMTRDISGYWFNMRKGEIEIATLYCPEYDAFLNQSVAER